MKLKRLIALMLCVLTVGTCSMATACTKPEGPSQDGKTINVKMVLAGYGTDWLQDIADAFETLYAEEGYKVNILEPLNSFTGSAALNEMRMTYEETGYDLVITTGNTIQKALGLDGEGYGPCIANMDDVYNNGAINFDGSVDSTTIKDLASAQGVAERVYINDGHYYTMGYVNSIKGLVCNTKVMQKYGITNLPRTTDELFEMFDIILNEDKKFSDVTGIRPIAWAGGNGYGYALDPQYVNIAQMMGVSEYDKFFNLDYLLDQDGKIDPDGWKIYEDEMWKDLFEVYLQEWDVLYSSLGSKTQEHTDADAQVVRGQAAFMFNGDYFYNEVRNDFERYLGDVRFTKVPLISALGTKLGLHTDEETCDEILRLIVEKCDNSVATAQIETEVEAAISGVDINETQIERIREARSVCGGGGGTGMYVMKDSPVKDITYKLLRMVASADAGKVFSKYGMIGMYNPAEPETTAHQFNKDTAYHIANKTYTVTSSLVPGSVRALTNMFLIPNYNAAMPVRINGDSLSAGNIMPSSGKASDRDYVAFANTLYTKVLNETRDGWKDLIEKGGYSLATKN